MIAVAKHALRYNLHKQGGGGAEVNWAALRAPRETERGNLFDQSFRSHGVFANQSCKCSK